ncbi:MAG: cytochrome c [Candidatus Acidiferrales bacterium]
MKGSRIQIGQMLFLACALTFVLSISTRADDSATVYKAKCEMCHAADGSGNTPAGKALKARDFASPEVQSETDAQLTEILTNGKNKMPAYKGKLTNDQIKGLVSYIRELAKKK